MSTPANSPRPCPRCNGIGIVDMLDCPICLGCCEVVPAKAYQELAAFVRRMREQSKLVETDGGPMVMVPSWVNR